MKSDGKPFQKSYRQGSSLYFSVGLLLSMVLVTTAFEWKFPYQITDNGPIDVISDPDPGPIMENPVLPDMPKPKPPGTEIIEVPDLTENNIDEPLPPEPVINTPSSTDVPDFIFTTGLPGEDIVDDKPDITEAAVPVGGFDAFYGFVYDNLKIPQHLISQGKSGKVYVSFVVSTNGELTDIQIVKGFDKELEERILKLLQESPAWQPAWKSGDKVPVRMQLPISIKIQ